MDLIKSHYRQTQNTQAIKKTFKKDEEKTMLSCIQRNHRKPAPSVFCSSEVLLLSSCGETRVYQLGARSSRRYGGMTEVEVLRTRRVRESFTGKFPYEISLGTAFS